jgi:hypothetical protein
MTTNLKQPPVRVSHSALKRWDDDSAYKSVCPACEKGPLLIVRDMSTYKLTNVDRCLGCAQLIIYTDQTINGEPVVDVAGIRNEN